MHKLILLREKQDKRLNEQNEDLISASSEGEANTCTDQVRKSKATRNATTISHKWKTNLILTVNDTLKHTKLSLRFLITIWIRIGIRIRIQIRSALSYCCGSNWTWTWGSVRWNTNFPLVWKNRASNRFDHFDQGLISLLPSEQKKAIKCSAIIKIDEIVGVQVLTSCL